MRSYSYSKISNPSNTSTSNLLSLAGDNSSPNTPLHSSASNHGFLGPRCNADSLVLPSTSFVIPRRQFRVAALSLPNGESPLLQRYSDIFANSGHSSMNVSGEPVRNEALNMHKDAAHHLSHTVITESNNNFGIEEIGLDYMRANGAIPAFRQLQHSLSRPNDYISSRMSLMNCLSGESIPRSRSFDKPKSNHNVQRNILSSDRMDNINYEKVLPTHFPKPSQKYMANKETQALSSKSMKSVGYRLGHRKDLYEKRLRISDFSLSFAIFGILVMVIDAELLWAGIYRKNSIYSSLLKSLISISTLVLLGLVLAYHALVIQLFSCDDSIEDWKIAITWHSVAQLTIELIICSIHPVPGHYSISRYFASSTNNATIDSSRLEFMIEPMLSLPMLLRFYMIFRSLLLHSRMFRDAGSRSIGAMNKVSFDTRFILKTLMTMSPGTMLLTFILSLWILLSWTMRMCEINTEYPRHANLLNCMWLIAVTFLSIGYGDIVPHTNCGRGIAVTAGVMGSACTALLVAVFARKLELSKAEKHVTQFMLENQNTKKLKYHAANVLRETWLIYKYTKLVKHVNPSKVRTHQRKFLKAIHGLRKSKIDQRKFKDNSNTLVDLAKTQTNIYETVTEMRVNHSCLDQRISRMENNIQALQEQIKILPGILCNILSVKLDNNALAQ